MQQRCAWDNGYLVEYVVYVYIVGEQLVSLSCLTKLISLAFMQLHTAPGVYHIAMFSQGKIFAKPQSIVLRKIFAG